MVNTEKPTVVELLQLRTIADIQFGKGAGDVLFQSDVSIIRSKGTKRIRYVYHNDERICSFRVQDGYLTLSLKGGEMLYNAGLGKYVIANSDAEPFIRKSRSLFAKHVVEADDTIAVRDEVIILNEKKEFIGVGVAKIPGVLMKEITSGVAVETRKGKKEQN